MDGNREGGDGTFGVKHRMIRIVGIQFASSFVLKLLQVHLKSFLKQLSTLQYSKDVNVKIQNSVWVTHICQNRIGNK